MHPRGRLALALALALAAPAAAAQTVIFTPTTAEDDRAADALIEREASAAGVRLTPTLLRLLRRRTAVISSLGSGCPAAFRFANVGDEALYTLSTFRISTVTVDARDRARGLAPGEDTLARSANGVDASEIPYLPARQRAVVYVPCVRQAAPPPHLLSEGRALDELDLHRLLVERRAWGTDTTSEFGPGYLVRADHLSDARATAIELANWSSMPAADRDAFRARLATSWRGGRALYHATHADGRDALVPPPGATPDGLVGIASARLDDPEPSTWDAAPYGAACPRATTRARLDAWLAANDDPTRDDPLAAAVRAACAPGRRDLDALSVVASSAWRSRRDPGYGLAPHAEDPGPHDTEGDYFPDATALPPLDPAAAATALATLDDALFEAAATRWHEDPGWAQIWTRAAALTPSAARATALLDRVAGDDPDDRLAALANGLDVGAGWRQANASWLASLTPSARATIVERWTAALTEGRLRPAPAERLAALLAGDPTFRASLQRAEEASPFDPDVTRAALPDVGERFTWTGRARCRARDASGALLRPCLVAIANAEGALERAPLRAGLQGPAIATVARLLVEGRGDASESAPFSRSLVAHGVPAASVAAPWCDHAGRQHAEGEDRRARLTLGTLDTIAPGAACATSLRDAIASAERRSKLPRAAVLLAAVALVAAGVRYARKRRDAALDADLP
ncbi:MAG: hypothetical protein U0324_44440 [Polyangiales bacterium]